MCYILIIMGPLHAIEGKFRKKRIFLQKKDFTFYIFQEKDTFFGGKVKFFIQKFQLSMNQLLFPGKMSRLSIRYEESFIYSKVMLICLHLSSLLL